MLRRPYYQSHGNPIQLARLPIRPLQLAFPIRDLAKDRQVVVFLKVWVLVFSVVLFESLAHFFVRPLYQSSAVEVILSLTGLLIAYRISAWMPNSFWLSFLVVCLTIVSLGLATYTNFAIVALPGVVLFGLYVRRYVEHWMQICTASPFPEHRRLALTRQWRGYLFCIQWAPVVVLLATLFLGLPLAFAFGGIGLIAIAHTLHAAGQFGSNQTVRAMWLSAVSWFSYNFRDQRLPGTIFSRGGARKRRLLFACVHGMFVAACMRASFIEFSNLAPSDVSFSLSLCFFASVSVVMLPAMLAAPLIAEVNQLKTVPAPNSTWSIVNQELRQSTNPLARNSYFMGQVVEDGSPLVVPRSVYREHGHFLGDSGSGKTSLGPAPFIEQTIAFGDCSVVIIDLKADSKELLATAMQAARQYRYRSGIELPIKFFNNQDDLASFGLNIFRQDFWPLLNTYTQTDVIAGATGLEYGTDYGASYYSATNAAVLYHTLKLYPDISSFSEMAERIGYVIANAKNRDLHAEVRKAGVHVHEVCKRLGAFPQLNVTDEGAFDEQVVKHSIDLGSVFHEPQVLYFELSSLLSPGSSPAIARMVVYFMLAAASKTNRDCPVILVIDEFQRMVAKNLEYMLQLARSMDVGVILANQSMEDLHTGNIDLVSPLEVNCRYRQWFSVSGSADRKRLVDGSGTTVEQLTSINVVPSLLGHNTTSCTYSEHILPRLTENDVMLASDHPKQSVVKISRGQDYAQYGGMPFIVTSDFHITKHEYEKRRAMTWPHSVEGTLVASDLRAFEDSKPDDGPIITIDEPEKTTGTAFELDQILDAFHHEIGSSPRKRKSKRRRRDG